MNPTDILLQQTLRFLTSGIPVSALPSVEWRDVLQVARRYQLEPAMAAAIPAALLPGEIAGQLAAAARQRRIRNMVLTQQFVTIQRALGQAGIRAVPLKGVALANSVYATPTLRYFDDIDILIPPGRGDEALAVLRQLGYEPHPRAEKPDWHHLPPQSHPYHGTTVELHVDVVRRGRGRQRWPIEGIWGRVRPATVAGAPGWLLDNIDALVYTALHARHHLYDKPSFLVDAVLLARQIEDVALLRERARAAGARTALAYLLTRARALRLYPGLPQLSVWRWRLALAQRVHDPAAFAPLPTALQAGALPKAAELLLTDSWLESVRLGGALLWPSADFVSAGYPSAGRRLRSRGRLAARQLVGLIKRSSSTPRR